MCLKDGEVFESFSAKKDNSEYQLIPLHFRQYFAVEVCTREKRRQSRRFLFGQRSGRFSFLCLNPCISSLDLFEMQSALAEMSERTAKLNGFDCAIHCTKIQDIGKEFDDKFSLVLCNPPYERAGFETTFTKKPYAVKS